jgi:GAF domain-containing protein
MIAWIKRMLAPPDEESGGAMTSANTSFTARYAILGAVFGLLFPLVAVGILMWSRSIPVQLSNLVELYRTEPLLWIIATVPLFLGFFAAIAGRRQEMLRQAYAQLQAEREESSQHQQVAQHLKQRVGQLSIVTEVSQQLSTILDLNELLVEVVNQIKDKLDCYHAHIYLLDHKREMLVVEAGTGAAGEEMKANRHNIPLAAPTSLVARAARSKDVVRVDNVRQAEDWLPNPLLPDTCSEMAVPILLEEQVVGVLDVQEDKIGGLDEAVASLLWSLANHVAMAIRNARLFEQVENALAEARAAEERYLEQTWQKSKAVGHQGQYVYAHPEAAPLDPASWRVLAEVRRQAQGDTHSTVVMVNDESKAKSLVAPVTLRDWNIGAVQLYSSSPDQVWSEDDLVVIEAVVDQLAQTAENLRLFEEARERAGREQTLREISDKLRAAPNLDRLIAIATEELGQRLAASHAKLELGFQPAGHARPKQPHHPGISRH